VDGTPDLNKTMEEFEENSPGQGGPDEIMIDDD
jgi:hypothetical protein